jgi:hypothetical protein
MSLMGQYLAKSDVCVTSVQPPNNGLMSNVAASQFRARLRHVQNTIAYSNTSARPDSGEEKHEPVSDIDAVAVVVESMKALDPDRPIREADIGRANPHVRSSLFQP